MATARQLPWASSVLAGEELWKGSSNSAFDINRPLNGTEYGQRLADVGGNLSFLGAGAVDALGIDRPIIVEGGTLFGGWRGQLGGSAEGVFGYGGNLTERPISFGYDFGGSAIVGDASGGLFVALKARIGLGSTFGMGSEMSLVSDTGLGMWGSGSGLTLGGIAGSLEGATVPSNLPVVYNAPFATQQWTSGRVVTMFDKEIYNNIIASPVPTVGRPDGGAWVMPASAVMDAESQWDLAITSGHAGRILAIAQSNMQMVKGGPYGDEMPVYAAFIPTDGLTLRPVSPGTPGANGHYTGLGCTGVRGGDDTTGFLMLNLKAVESNVDPVDVARGITFGKFTRDYGWVPVHGKE